MAIGATTVWRVRASGNAANGGGFDPGIAGAATDYTDQNAAQLSITDGATSGAGSTTLTSAAAGFTSAMVGNCIRISAGTNFQTGYYFITVFTSSTTVIVDRTPTSGGAGSGGTGSIGGAFAKINQFANGGTQTQPTITTPLAAGHTVYIRGAGSSDPTSVDYTNTGGYLSFPSGDTTSGAITFIGYNGTPLLSCDALFAYLVIGTRWIGIKFKVSNTTNIDSGGVLVGSNGNEPNHARSCIFDQNSNDCEGITRFSVLGCWFKNDGATQTAGTRVAVTVKSMYGLLISGNVINGWRGGGVLSPTTALCSVIVNNIIANVKANPGIDLETTSIIQADVVYGNTIYNGAAEGIKIGSTQAIANAQILNNIISNNATYGINCAVGSTALNERSFLLHPNYNDVYNNTTANYNNMSAGANDLALDPQFTNAAGGDFSIGTNLKAAGFPGAFLSATTTGYLDIGAVQRKEPVQPAIGSAS